MSMRPDGLGPQPVPPVGDPDGVKKLYGDDRTKQGFRDETDIKAILKKAQRVGSLSHLQKHGAHYGDFSDVDGLLAAYMTLERGKQIYNELPSEIRKEFPNQFDFYRFVTDPSNADHLQEMLPALAEPGRVNPAVLRDIRSEANPAVASAEPVTEAPTAPDAGDTPAASSST